MKGCRQHRWIPVGSARGRRMSNFPGMLVSRRCVCGATQLTSDPDYTPADHGSARDVLDWIEARLPIPPTPEPEPPNEPPAEWSASHPPIKGGATINASATGGNVNATTCWVGGVLPGAGDDVTLTSTSGPVTINVSTSWLTLDCTGYTSTLTHAAAVNLTIAGIKFLLVAGMTYTLGSTTTSALLFTASTAVTVSITCGGKTLGNVTTASGLTSSSATYSCADANTVGAAANLQHNAGTFTTNNQTCSWGTLNSSNANTRTITLGTSTVTITGTAVSWNIATATGLTLNATTSTLNFNVGASAPTFQMGSKTYGTVILSSWASQASITTFTATTFTITGQANKTSFLTLAGNVTVTGTLSLNANSTLNALFIQSNVLGTSRTFTAATLVASGRVDFSDVTGAGAATWTTGASGAAQFGDCGGNGGITMTTPATQTWSGTAGGNFSANAWSGRVPLPQDTAVLASAFVGSPSVALDMPRIGSIDFTGATGTPNWTMSLAGGATIYGSVTMITGMTRGSFVASIIFGGRGNYTLTCAGKLWTGTTYSAPGGTMTLQDAYSAGTSTLSITNGNWIFNNQSSSCGVIQSTGTATRGLTLGTSTVTLTSTGTVWNMVATGLTLSAASSTIIMTDVSATAKTFAGAGLTHGNLTITAGGTGSITFTGANSFGTITCTGGSKSLILPASTTTTVANFNCTGTAGNLVALTSSSPGTQFTLSCPNIVSCDYLSVTDSTAAGVTPFYAGSHGTVTTSTNWQATANQPITLNSAASASASASATGGPVINIVQSVMVAEQGSSSTVATLAGASTTGNALIVGITLYSSDGYTNEIDMAASNPVTDGTNTFVPITGAEVKQPGAAGHWYQHIYFYVATKITGKSTEAITCNFARSTFNFVSAWELTPCQFNQAIETTGTGTTINLGSLTPPGNALSLEIVAYDGDNGGTPPAFTLGSGWIADRDQQAGGGSTLNAHSQTMGPVSFSQTGPSGGSQIWAASGIVLIPGVSISASGAATTAATMSITVPTATPQPITVTASGVASATATITASTATPVAISPRASANTIATNVLTLPVSLSALGQATSQAIVSIITVRLLPSVTAQAISTATATVTFNLVQFLAPTAQATAQASNTVTFNLVQFLTPVGQAVTQASSQTTATALILAIAQAQTQANELVTAQSLIVLAAQAISQAISKATIVPAISLSAQSQTSAQNFVTARAVLSVVAQTLSQANSLVTAITTFVPVATVVTAGINSITVPAFIMLSSNVETQTTCTIFYPIEYVVSVSIGSNILTISEEIDLLTIQEQ